MTPEPNDRTPLDFTRPLELVCDGTEVVVIDGPDEAGDYGIQRADGLPFFADQHPQSRPDPELAINASGRWWMAPTGSQIVRNRVEACGDAGQPLCSACSVPITELVQEPGCGTSITPAAPEPDGEVVEGWLITTCSGRKIVDRHRPTTLAEGWTCEPLFLRIPTPAPQSGEGLAGELDSYEKFDGIGPHTETIETRARIGEAYLEAYQSALTDPLLKDYTPADCPSELLLDLLERLREASPATIRQEAMEEAARIADAHAAHSAKLMEAGGDEITDLRVAHQMTSEQIARAIRNAGGARGN